MQLKEKEIENIKNKWEIWEILRQLFGDERIYFFFLSPEKLKFSGTNFKICFQILYSWEFWTLVNFWIPGFKVLWNLLVLWKQWQVIKGFLFLCERCNEETTFLLCLINRGNTFSKKRALWLSNKELSHFLLDSKLTRVMAVLNKQKIVCLILHKVEHQAF